jgi:hypothetical protein
MRTVYEARERPSRMYGWTALVTSQVLAAIPWNICGSTLLFLTWFWTVGYDSSRAGYTYLMLGVIFPLYYTTIGQVRQSSSCWVECSNLLVQGNCSNVTESGGGGPAFFCSILICDHFVSHSRFKILPENLTPFSLATGYCSLSVILGGGAGCKFRLSSYGDMDSHCRLGITFLRIPT